MIEQDKMRRLYWTHREAWRSVFEAILSPLRNHKYSVLYL